MIIAVLTIFPVILQTVINLIMLSIGGKGEQEFFTSQEAISIIKSKVSSIQALNYWNSNLNTNFTYAVPNKH